MAVLVLGDLDLPIRGRTYVEPQGEHVAVARGRSADEALDHLAERPDCGGLALVGLPVEVPEGPGLEVLAGRRLLLCAADRSRVRAWSRAAMEVEAEVEWVYADAPTPERLAAWALPVGAVVLAAGQASRMGANKLLLEVSGQPLVCHVVEAAAEGGCDHVVVVYADDAVRAEVAGAATCVRNPDALSGQASSLRVGLAATEPGLGGAVILLGDQPLVGSRTVGAVIAAWRREDAAPAVAARYGDGAHWRPPVLVERALFPRLMELTGDAGARQLLDPHPELLATVPALGLADDVDTPEDYARIIRLHPPGR